MKTFTRLTLLVPLAVVAVLAAADLAEAGGKGLSGRLGGGGSIGRVMGNYGRSNASRFNSPVMKKFSQQPNMGNGYNNGNHYNKPYNQPQYNNQHNSGISVHDLSNGSQGQHHGVPQTQVVPQTKPKLSDVLNGAPISNNLKNKLPEKLKPIVDVGTVGGSGGGFGGGQGPVNHHPGNPGTPGHHGDHHGNHNGHHHHNPNWSWIGYSTPWVYPVGGYHQGGHCVPTVIDNPTVVEQPVVQAPAAGAVATQPEAATAATDPASVPPATKEQVAAEAAAADLELRSVFQLDPGSIANGVGPTYRVVVKNVSATNVDSPFSVTLVAAKADRSFDGTTPRTDEPVLELAAGAEKLLDIRLPVESLSCEKDAQNNEAPFSTLLVVIDGYAKLSESNRDNNAAAVARLDVENVLPTVASAATVAKGSTNEISVAGQSFGTEQGKVMIDLGPVRVPAEVVSWDAEAIRVKLPAIETAANITTRLVVVRADGVTAQPFDLTPNNVAAK